MGHGPELVVCPSEGARVLLPLSHPGLYARPDPVTTCSLREHSNSSVLAGFESLRLGRVVTGRVDPRHRMMPVCLNCIDTQRSGRLSDPEHCRAALTAGAPGGRPAVLHRDLLCVLDLPALSTLQAISRHWIFLSVFNLQTCLPVNSLRAGLEHIIHGRPCGTSGRRRRRSGRTVSSRQPYCRSR